MKKSILKKLVASIVLVSAIIFSGLPIFAQQSYKGEKNKSEKRKYTKRTKDNKYDKKRDYQTKNHKKQRQNDKYSKVRTRDDRGDRYRKERIVRRHNDYRYNRYAQGRQNHQIHGVSSYYKRQAHKSYLHSRYGNVVVQFATRPIIINHRDGNFYYSRGRYYQYYPEVGYVRVNVPESIYFDDVPNSCERISYRGGVYFRLGDLNFVKNGRGFRLAGSIRL
ncbi:DUF6515 family protein [Ancylomarina sp. 16SWW S1-10-2]|uniref:DUF6515 family protein n=1 Tax=Ancylomarina sp. 16SWW S1-10-2 TaxID=2499681 RepID=UPI0012AE2E77|nr:DUF6515 family protein [Ancylomarina sp. 16SWW S1-10-2]MRT94650.1 hypothetical protein [Ancylomarina sp. 16SWW S1-10-2]